MSRNKYTREDIIRLVKEENVRFIRLQFTDIFGTLKNVAITADQIEKALDNKCMFDGSSVEGFVRIEESDMYLYPDYDSFMIIPWNQEKGKTARLICDIKNADQEPVSYTHLDVYKRQVHGRLKALKVFRLQHMPSERDFLSIHRFQALS